MPKTVTSMLSMAGMFLRLCEREMKALGGGGLSGIVCIHDLAGRPVDWQKANRTSDLIVGKYLCVGGGRGVLKHGGRAASTFLKVKVKCL